MRNSVLRTLSALFFVSLPIIVSAVFLSVSASQAPAFRAYLGVCVANDFDEACELFQSRRTFASKSRCDDYAEERLQALSDAIRTDYPDYRVTGRSLCVDESAARPQ